MVFESKMLKHFVIFIGLTVASAAPSPSSLKLLFPAPAREYSYKLKTNVSSGTLTPVEDDSSWELEGQLVLRVFNNYTRVRFWLENLKTSVYSKNHGFSSYQSEEAALQLKRPWEVDYQDDGLINFIYVEPDDPIWATNIRKALSVNFQLRNDIGTYSYVEPCLYGVCDVVYIVDSDQLRIRKFNSLQLTVPLSWYQDYGRNGVPDSITTAERVFTLDDKGLRSLELKGDFQYKTYNHILTIASTLSLYYENDKPSENVHKINLNQVGIQYETHDLSDPSNGIRNWTQKYLSDRTYKILLKIASKGIDADNIMRNGSLIHSLDFIDLLNTMAQLNLSSLTKLFEDMVLGTSYEVETARNILLEVLPHVRTNDCAMFVKYLVLEQKEKIEDTMMLALIRKLPFNVANYSQKLLEELEVFTKLSIDYHRELRYAGILSFGTLVYKTRKATNLTYDYLDNTVVKYFRMYSDCPQYLDRMVWLQGLCNMGYFAESYTRTIFGDIERDRHERLWAAVGGVRYAAHNPFDRYRIFEMTLPILINPNEHIHLRVAALHVFLSSDMQASDFMYVHNYIKGCGNDQLKRFWYTTVKSLEANKYFDGYRAASYFIPFIARQVTNPGSLHWATGNYIVQSENDDSAASLHVMSVGEQQSALPSFASLHLCTGRSKRAVQLYIIAEGVTTNMFKKLHALNAIELYIDKLADVLKNMHVRIAEPEKVHIDLVVKIHDKTVYATHINQSTFDSWNGEDLTRSIEDFIRFGSHINQQMVYYPFQRDVTVPTVLGTPIRLQSAIVSFTSIRGNLTAPSTHDLTWRNDIHIRYQGTTVTSLSTDGPLLQSEHLARVQQSIVAHLPMKFDVTLTPVDRAFEIKWPNPGAQHGGIAMHSRTQISSESTTGIDAYTVTAKDYKPENDDSGIFFDCERPLTHTEVLEKILMSKTGSYDFITTLHPSRLLLNLIHLMTSPTSGPCGVILPPRRLMVAGNNILHAKFKVEELSLNLDDRIKVKITHSLSFRENSTGGQVFLNINGYTDAESAGGNLTVEVILVGEQPNAVDVARRKWKICFQEQDISHPSSDQDIIGEPSMFEGHMSLTYSSGDTTLTCPAAESQLVVQYKGIPTNVKGNLERYFEVQVVGRKLPKLSFLSELGLDNHQVLQQLVNSFYKTPFNVTAAITEKNGLASMSINSGPELRFSSDNFVWLLDSWSDMQIMRKFGIYRECRLNESSIETLTGHTDYLSPVECMENLVLADCTAAPKFAVLRLKGGGIKVYVGGNYVTVSPSKSELKATVNGQFDCPDDCVYPTDEPIYDFKVSRKGDVVKIHSRLSGVQVYYTRSETVILMPNTYMSTSCGACMDEQYYNLC